MVCVHCGEIVGREKIIPGDKCCAEEFTDGCMCTKPKNHKGKHAACGLGTIEQHPLHVWEG